MEALAGIRVLDFTQMMFGPWATQMLADVGAEVIKVEPLEGEWERRLTAEGQLLDDTSPFFIAMNRNKKCVALNLKEPLAQKAMQDLMGAVDVVVHNFRPGVMDRLNLGYEAAASVKPDIIYCEGSGYGSDGPYAHRPGQDLLIQSMSGIAANTGRFNDPPTPVGSSISDAFGALHLVQAILVALLARERQGVGQRIEVNLLGASIAALCQEATAYLNMDGLAWQRSRNGIGRMWLGAPFGIYAVLDGHIALAMGSLRTVGEALDAPEIVEASEQDAFANRDELAALIQGHLAGRRRQEVLDLLLERDVWAAPVYTFGEVFEDPQVRHLGLVEEHEHPRYGRLRLIASPIKYGKTPAAIKFGPARVGEHTGEILTGLGYTSEEISAMTRPSEK